LPLSKPTSAARTAFDVASTGGRSGSAATDPESIPMSADLIASAIDILDDHCNNTMGLPPDETVFGDVLKALRHAQRLQDSLAKVVRLVDDTAAALERESLDLAEVGCWSGDQRAAFEQAKRLITD
jgi:hypothetical protein